MPLKFLSLIVVLTILVFGISYSETPLRILYDPRVSSKKPYTLTQNLSLIMRSVALNKKSFAKRFQERLSTCEEDRFQEESVGVFTGSFTKNKIVQTGHAIIVCEHTLVIAILENEKITSLIGLASKYNTSICDYQEVYAVRDINRNGISEIAMTFGCGDGGGVNSTFFLREFQNSKFNLLCEGKVRFGQSDGVNSNYWEKIVYVNPQPNLLFVAQKLFLKDSNNWDSKQFILSDQMTTFCDQNEWKDSFEISLIRL
jgi:hypothetical protein